MSVNIRITKLMFGTLGPNTLHVCVDMQRLFAEPGDWFTQELDGIVPAVSRLVSHRPDRTVFTRFMTPASPDQATGRWRDYYRRWQAYTTDAMGEDKLELVAPLQEFCPPASVIDKTTHSAFESPDFTDLLGRESYDTLVLSGVETDVCVLATALTAVDRGLRVVLVPDALASSSPEGHNASLNDVISRFDMQIETALLDEVLAAWA